MRPEWGHPKPPRGKRALVITGVTVSTLALASILGLFVIYPRVGASAIRNKMLPKLSARIGHSIDVRDVDVGLGRAVLEGVTINDAADGTRLATIPKIVLRFGLGASLLGRIKLETVVVYDAELITIIAEDGSTPWDAMRAWLAKKSKAGGGGGRSGLIPKRAEVRRASYELRDQRHGLTAVGEELDATLESGRLTATTGDLTVMTRVGLRAELVGVTLRGRVRELGETAELEITDGSLALWPGMTLTGIAGTVAPASSGEALWIDLSGGWGGSEGRVWKAVGSFDPRTRSGEVLVGAERFDLNKIANVLGGTPLRNIDKTSLGGELKIKSDGKTINAEGSVEVDRLSVFHPRLAAETLEDVSLTGEVEATYTFATQQVDLKRAVMRTGGVEYQVNGMLRRGKNRAFEELHARLRVPPVECQAVLDSLPPALLPKLQGFKLRGTFDTDFEVHVQRDKLEDTVLSGSVGIRNCDVTAAAKGMSAGKIRGQFRHRTIVGFTDGKPRYRTMTIGPENSAYVSLGNVSPYLVNSLLTTEDSSFFRHRGFIVSEFRTALIKNLEAGFFRYGASSITMQLVKNVYLDRQKTMSRKLQELFMTWYVETKVKKSRIMEVYVNAIEYGPGLYGIGNASHRYFGKRAAELNPTESAFFSSILPAPRRRFRQYCRDKLTGWTERKIERILGLMLKRNRINEAEFEQAMITPIAFRGDKTGCGRR